MTATMVRSGKAMCMKRTTGEKLHLMEIMERANKQRVARMKPATVDCWWYKETKYSKVWCISVRNADELIRRGCTHAGETGWSLQDAVRKLNRKLEVVNLSVGEVAERPW